MGSITALSEINIPSVLFGVLVIIVAIVFIVDLVVKVMGYFGKPVLWVKQHNIDHQELIKAINDLEMIRKTQIEDRKISDAQDKHLEKKIDKLTEIFIDKQIDDYRWEIINSADKITNGRVLSRDAYQHCFNTYEKYEKVLKEYNKTNHEVDISIDVINKSYKDKLVNGFNYRVN